MVDEQTRWMVPGYAADELIGFGASGEVWRGRALDTGEAVALKRLRAGPADQARQRLAREAALLARIDHPHLLRVRELVSTSQEAVLVLDYASGGTLAALLRRRGRLRPGEVVTILAPVAAALAYAHDEGLVHGDVSPANVLFDEHGRPLLADLGVARVLGEHDDPQCTPDYIDPAVAAGGTPGAATDVFMTAGVALHALTGAPPWPADSPQQAVALAATGRVPALDRDVPEAPEALVRALRRGLSADPAARGTAAELALDIRHACPPEPVHLVELSPGIDTDLVPGPDTSTTLTHAVRADRPAAAPSASVPASSRSPRHRRDDRRPERSGLTEGAPPPTEIGRRPRSVRRTVGVAIALVAAALVGIAWGSGRSAGRPKDVASRAAARSGSEAPSPGRTASRHDRSTLPTIPSQATAARRWLSILDGLDEIRALAYFRGDASLLERVYVAGRHLRLDAAQLGALSSAGDTARGVRHRWGQFDTLAVSGRHVRLRVVQWLPPSQRLHHGTVVGTIPGTRKTAVLVDLVATPAGWRLT